MKLRHRGATELTPEVLHRLYVQEKLTDQQIADIAGVAYATVGRKRKTAGIVNLNREERLGLPALTDLQQELLTGSVLGDARLFTTGVATAALSEFHSLAQLEYLEWKQSLWGSLVCSVRDSKTTKNGKVYTGKILRTHGIREFRPFQEQLYPSGKGAKVFTKFTFTYFTPFALAIWFLDDGCKSNNGYVRFAVTPDQPSQQVQLSLLRGMGLDPVLHEQATDPAIWIHDRASLTRFLDLVSPHIPASMSYKLDLVPRARGAAPRDLLTPEVLTEHTLKGRGVAWIAEATGTSDTSVRKALNLHSLDVAQMDGLTTWDAAKAQIQFGMPDDQLVDTLTTLAMPTPPSRASAEKDYQHLQDRTLAKIKDGVIYGGGRVGLTVCEAFFPYRYEAARKDSMSVQQGWFSAEVIRKAVAFQRKVGDPVFPMNVFRAVKALLGAPSNFRPAVAKKLVETYAPSGGIVLDPCAGYGGRAVGTLAAGRGYVGADPHPKAGIAFAALRQVIGDLDFYNEPFEDTQLNVSADLVLTSPPYFSVERYSNDARQSWVRYPTWDLWVERFLKVLLGKCYNHLKIGGVMLLNVADSGQHPLVQTSLEAARVCGFRHHETLRMQLASFPKSREEPILVLVKDGRPEHVDLPVYSVPKAPPVVPVSQVTGLGAAQLRVHYEEQLLSDLQIADLYECSDVTISQVRKRYGIGTITPRQRLERKTGVRPLSGMTLDVLRDLCEASTDTEIARMFGTSKTTIRNCRKRFGLVRN